MESSRLINNKIYQGSGMSQHEITRIIVDTMYKTYFDYGPGLLEHVYELVLAKKLVARGLTVRQQLPIFLKEFPDLKRHAFVIDLLVEDRIIIELKSVTELHPVMYKQLRTYLKLTGLEVGFLVNFNCDLLKDNLKRVVNEFHEKHALSQAK